MMRRYSVSALVLACMLLGAAVLAASARAQQASRLIPFQGELSNGGGQPLTGSFALLFAIYDAPSGGTPLWSELHREVSINGGRVNVILGNQNPIGELPFGTQALHLGITVASSPSEIGSNQELIPRHQLIPSFHAASASETASVRDGAITTTKIANAAISTAKIAPNAVTAGQIGNGAIEARHIATAVANTLVPQGAIVLWDRSNTCPAGFSEATEFRNLMVRGADRAGANAEIPDNAGTSCSAVAGCPGGGAAARYDDRLQVEELASHSHAQVGRHDSDLGGVDQVQLGLFRGAPLASPPQGTGATGNDVAHYHPFRSVLFCRRN